MSRSHTRTGTPEMYQSSRRRTTSHEDTCHCLRVQTLIYTCWCIYKKAATGIRAGNRYLLYHTLSKEVFRYLTPVRTAIIKKTRDHKCWRGCGEKGTRLHCWWECKLAQPLQRCSLKVPQKIFKGTTI